MWFRLAFHSTPLRMACSLTATIYRSENRLEITDDHGLILFLEDREHVLGHGKHGFVFRAKTLPEGDASDFVATKDVEYFIDNDDEQRKRFCETREILRGLNHLNVLKCTRKAVEETMMGSRILLRGVVVMEYFDGVTLDYWMKNDGLPLESRQRARVHQIVRNFAGQILTGLSYLHREGLAHADLTTTNVMVSTKSTRPEGGWLIKIIDVDDCCSAFGLGTGAKGTPLYQPPAWDGPPLDPAISIRQKSDIFSYGIVVLFMLGFEHQIHDLVPSQPRSMSALPKHDVLPRYTWRLFQEGKFSTVEIDIADAAVLFLNRCLTVEPPCRPDAVELLRDFWFTGTEPPSLLETSSKLSATSAILYSTPPATGSSSVSNVHYPASQRDRVDLFRHRRPSPPSDRETALYGSFARGNLVTNGVLPEKAVLLEVGIFNYQLDEKDYRALVEECRCIGEAIGRSPDKSVHLLTVLATSLSYPRNTLRMFFESTAEIPLKLYVAEHDLSMTTVHRCIQQISAGTNYLHDNDLIHGNLTGSSIYAGAADNQDLQIKIGESRRLCQALVRVTGHQEFCDEYDFYPFAPPEFIRNYDPNKLPQKSWDVWGIGCTFIQILRKGKPPKYTQKLPNGTVKQKLVIERMHAAQLHQQLEKYLQLSSAESQPDFQSAFRIDRPDIYGEELLIDDALDFLDRCLDNSPEKRSVFQPTTHSFLQKKYEDLPKRKPKLGTQADLGTCTIDFELRRLLASDPEGNQTHLARQVRLDGTLMPDITVLTMKLSRISATRKQQMEKLTKFSDSIEPYKDIHLVQYLGMKFKEAVSKLDCPTACIISEYFPGGTISESAAHATTLFTVQSWMKQILNGLIYLHSNRVVHRNINGGDIFFEGPRQYEGNLKIGGFSFVRVLDSDQTRRHEVSHSRGYQTYMSPEMAQVEVSDETKSQNIGRRTDVWSFGVVALEMLNGRPIFYRNILENGAMTRKKIGDKARDICQFLHGRNGMPEVSEGTPDSLKAVLQRCFEVVEKQRVTSFELRQDPFFRENMLRLTYNDRRPPYGPTPNSDE